MFRKITILVLALAAVLTALTVISAAPLAAKNTAAVSSLVDGKAVPGARSALSADSGGVTVALHTFGLPPGSDTELWWWVYNTPERCHAGTGRARCGMADLWNEAAQPSAFYGSNQPILSGGKADFSMRRGVGDRQGAVFGAGVTNPLGAEIHLILISCVEGEGPAAGLASARRHCEKRQHAVHRQ